MNRQTILVILILVALGVGLFLFFNPLTENPDAYGFVYSYSSNPVWARQTGAIDHFRSWNGGKIQMYSNAGTALKFSQDGATGTQRHSGFSILDPAAEISVTNGITNLAPLGTFQPLISAGTVTITSLITGTNFITGTQVRLYVTSATSVILTNGTYLLLPLATNLTLGQNDGIWIWYDGSRWIATASVNN